MEVTYCSKYSIFYLANLSQLSYKISLSCNIKVLMFLLRVFNMLKMWKLLITSYYFSHMLCLFVLCVTFQISLQGFFEVDSVNFINYRYEGM